MAEATKEREQSTQERAYAVICLVSLLLVVVVMMLDGIGVWSVLPMLVGGVAFLLRWRSGPPLVLFVFLWMAPTRFHHGAETDTFLAWLLNLGAPSVNPASRRLDGALLLEDVLLCVALLSYTAACYRSLALAHSIFPPDLRRGRKPAGDRRNPKTAPMPQPLVPRPAEPASPSEIPIFAGALLAAALAALVLWFLADWLPGELELSPVTWRNVAFFWAFVILVSLCLAVFRYLGRCRGPVGENLLYLQDQLWLQTRHEQGTLNRWLVWARLRWQRRKER
jgi:hypothetical protein